MAGGNRSHAQRLPLRRIPPAGLQHPSRHKARPNDWATRGGRNSTSGSQCWRINADSARFARPNKPPLALRKPYENVRVPTAWLCPVAAIGIRVPFRVTPLFSPITRRRLGICTNNPRIPARTQAVPSDPIVNRNHSSRALLPARRIAVPGSIDAPGSLSSARLCIQPFCKLLYEKEGRVK